MTTPPFGAETPERPLQPLAKRRSRDALAARHEQQRLHVERPERAEHLDRGELELAAQRARLRVENDIARGNLRLLTPPRDTTPERPDLPRRDAEGPRQPVALRIELR